MVKIISLFIITLFSRLYVRVVSVITGWLSTIFVFDFGTIPTVQYYIVFSVRFWNYFDSAVLFCFSVRFWNYSDSAVLYCFSVRFWNYYNSALLYCFSVRFWNHFDCAVLYCFSFY